jgi:lipopolysaccharide transport system permease protein
MSSEDKADRTGERTVLGAATRTASRWMPAGLREGWRYRGLLWVLSLSQIQVRYKQSVLGLAWAVVQPLAMMFIFTLIFSVLLKVPSDGIPYPIFSYSALMFWAFFSGSLNGAIPSLEANAGLIKKIYFPREFFPISTIFAAMFDLVIAFFIFLGMMFYFEVHFTLNILYVIPLLTIQTIFMMGVCFIFSALNAYYRDIRYALPLVIQVWMYATPIIYPLSTIPARFQTYYALNPMTGLIESYRNVLVKGIGPEGFFVGVAAAGAVFILIVGYLYFKRIEMTFADVL